MLAAGLPWAHAATLSCGLMMSLCSALMPALITLCVDADVLLCIPPLCDTYCGACCRSVLPQVGRPERVQRELQRGVVSFAASLLPRFAAIASRCCRTCCASIHQLHQWIVPLLHSVMPLSMLQPGLLICVLHFVTNLGDGSVLIFQGCMPPAMLPLQQVRSGQRPL